MKNGSALLKEIEKAFKKEDIVSLVKTDAGDIVVIPGEAPPKDNDIFDTFDEPDYTILPEDESC